MSHAGETAIRDELADLLADDVRAHESPATVERRGTRCILLTDEDGDRFLVTVTYKGPARS